MSNESRGVVDVWPLSPLQQGLFALNRLSPQDPYHVQFTFRIDGSIDIDLLKQSLMSLLHRYPNLRAAFFDEDLDYPIQIIPQQVELRWEKRDIPCKEDILTDYDGEVLQMAKLEFSQSFDLAEGNLFRFLFITNNKNLHYLILTAHHIVIDGWSLPIFFQELMSIYLVKNQVALLKDPPDYKDYVIWLDQRNKVEVLARWKEYLKNVQHPTLLSSTREVDLAAGVPLRFRSALSIEETKALQFWCQTNQLTITSIFLIAWAYVLRSIKNEDDVIFGLTIAGRPAEIANIESMIGLFINTIPCRVKLSPYKTLLEQAKNLQNELAEMRDYGVVGIADIQRAIKMNELFDSLVIFQNTPVSSEDVFNLNDACVSPLKSFDSTHYPLTLVCAVVANQLNLEAEVRSDQGESINGAELIDSVIFFLKTVPEYATQYLGKMPTRNNMISNYESDIQYVYDDIWGLFEKNVNYLSAQEALIVPRPNQREKIYTWLQLKSLIGKVATLIKNCIAINSIPCRVGIILPRNEYLIVSMLACVRLKVTIVPFDYITSKDRIEKISKNADLKLIVTDQDIILDNIPVLNLNKFDIDNIKEDQHEHKLISIDQELYIIFTSGTTGEPKGVVVSHRDILALIESYKILLSRDFKDLRVGHAWSFAFDASWQPLSMFLMGNTLVLLDEETQRDPDLFIYSIEQYSINVIETSPTMLKQINFIKLLREKTTDLKILGLGGEAIDSQLWQQLSKIEKVKIVNFYGPTETTVDAIVADISSEDIPVIGHPLAGIRVEILDNWLNPCPVGVIGELYLSGEQLTQGYLNNSQFTACRFVAGDGGSRRYRTGDLVSSRISGALIYHGRADSQVKIRGFRIESKDIEKNLLLDDRVKDCAVFSIHTETGLRLAAAVILQDKTQDESIEKSILKKLRERVPHYLVPHYIVSVQDFPMTINGKLDIAALPRPNSMFGQKPSTEIELKLDKILKGILSMGEDSFIDVNEDLQYYGLDSIMVMQLTNRLKQEGYSITPRMIMKSCSIRGIASELIHSFNHSTVVFDDNQTLILTPIMRWLLQFEYWQRFCQWIVISIPDTYDETIIKRHFNNIIATHPMLRLRVSKNKNKLLDSDLIFQSVVEVQSKDWLMVQNKSLEKSGEEEIGRLVEQAVNFINPEHGINFKLLWFKGENNLGGHLLILIHHLVVDGVSWRILLDDFRHLENDDSSIMKEVTPFTRWSQFLQKKSQSEEVKRLLPQWQSYLKNTMDPIGYRLVDKHKDLAVNSLANTIVSSVSETEILAQLGAYTFSIEHALISILVEVIYRFYQIKNKIKNVELFELLIDRESHGREEKILSEYGEAYDDISRTVGWCTVVSPVKLTKIDDDDIFVQLKHIQEQLLNTPSDGLDYTLLCQNIPSSGAEIEFNYHGFLGNQQDSAGNAWHMLNDKKILDTLPEVTEPLLNRFYALEVNTAVVADQGNNQITVRLNASADVFTKEDFTQLSDLWQREFSNTCQKIAKKLKEMTKTN